MNIRNPFKHNQRARAFDACVAIFAGGGFRNSDKSPSRGTPMACYFWNGYNGDCSRFIDRNTLAWVAYRAGRACANANGAST